MNLPGGWRAVVVQGDPVWEGWEAIACRNGTTIAVTGHATEEAAVEAIKVLARNTI